MTRATKTQRGKPLKRPRGKTEFPGIVEDARGLGVSRTHLYRVLIGERESKSLMKRYRELKGGAE